MAAILAIASSIPADAAPNSEVLSKVGRGDFPISALAMAGLEVSFLGPDHNSHSCVSLSTVTKSCIHNLIPIRFFCQIMVNDRSGFGTGINPFIAVYGINIAIDKQKALTNPCLRVYLRRPWLSLPKLSFLPLKEQPMIGV